MVIVEASEACVCVYAELHMEQGIVNKRSGRAETEKRCQAIGGCLWPGAASWPHGPLVTSALDTDALLICSWNENQFFFFFSFLQRKEITTVLTLRE